jgi:predicted N-acetyltransferase YhbS
MTDANGTAGQYAIRTATAATVESFTGPLNLAFAEMPDPGDEERRVWEPDRIIAAFDGELPVATAGAVTFRLSVPGGEAAAAGVTLVGVSPAYRRRGILRSMMRHQLDDVRARGEPLAILWASEGAIYQRFGYGLATLSGRFEIARDRAVFARPAPPRGASGWWTVRLQWASSRRSTTGSGSRHPGWWRAARRGGAG